MSATRYVLPAAGPDTFEIPIVVRGLRAPKAILAISAHGLFYALAIALEWANRYSEANDFPHWPTVEYRGRRYEVHRVSSSTAWIENHNRAQWVPVETLSA